MQSDKFHFTGHTDYLKSKLNATDVLMFMLCESMKIGFVTGHMALKDVAGALTVQLIMHKLKLMNRSSAPGFCNTRTAHSSAQPQSSCR